MITTTVLKSWVAGETVLFRENLSPQVILFICETIPFARANHLSKTSHFGLPEVGNYQSPYRTGSTVCRSPDT